MKIGRIKEIMISREKGKPRESIREGFLDIDFGLRGDIKGGPGKMQVVLFGVEGIARLSDSPEEGLCFKRFFPTITTAEIDLFRSSVGNKLKIGESILEITRIGKRCFPECVLVQAGTPCIMPREVVYTRVVRAGTVRVGDEIQMVDTI
ncbi:MAG: MOSC domain-containing protein [Candidatus Auribacterota bacterium]|nr:MOSC domain-containing protein [Candidatus Auribacterota bacterium]